jgi:hypothetical protein
MLNSSQSRDGGGYGLATDHASELMDQLLALGKKATDAYADVFQKTAAGFGEFQDKLGMVGTPSWDMNGAADWQPALSNGKVGDQLAKARDRAMELGEKLEGMRKTATLGYLDACEQALLAVADLQEEIAATSNLDFVKTVSGARVDFTRELTKACCSAAREIVG